MQLRPASMDSAGGEEDTVPVQSVACFAAVPELKTILEEENPYHKDEEFLKISPKGLVPAVKYQGKPINESQVILEFIEDGAPVDRRIGISSLILITAYPDHKPNLRPSDPWELAQMRLAVDVSSQPEQSLLQWLTYLLFRP